MSGYPNTDNGQSQEEKKFPSELFEAEDYVSGRMVTKGGSRSELDTNMYPSGRPPASYDRGLSATPPKSRETEPGLDMSAWKEWSKMPTSRTLIESNSPRAYSSLAGTWSSPWGKRHSTRFEGIGSYWEARIEQKLAEQQRK